MLVSSDIKLIRQDEKQRNGRPLVEPDKISLKDTNMVFY